MGTLTAECLSGRSESLFCLGGFLMVFDDSFESSLGNNFFLVSFKNNMGFVCWLLERTGFKITVEVYSLL